MSIQIYTKNRSMQSYILEKCIFLSGTKKAFSSPENTEKFVQRKGAINRKPYVIRNVKFTSKIKEQVSWDMQVFTLNDKNSSEQKVILYIHGGAWTHQPLRYHWIFMDQLAQSLDAKIVVPIYPKLPDYNHKDTYSKLLNLYVEILKTVKDPNQLTIMGDSAGGNISLSLANLLKESELPQPKDIILLSACVDMELSNPLIPVYEKKDPMLSAGGMDVITKAWANNKILNDPIISPINGNLKGIAKITHFIGTHEALYPDAIKLDKKLTAQGIEIHTFVYPKMNHVFVLMPISEAKHAMKKIIHIIES